MYVDDLENFLHLHSCNFLDFFSIIASPKGIYESEIISK